MSQRGRDVCNARCAMAEGDRRCPKYVTRHRGATQGHLAGTQPGEMPGAWQLSPREKVSSVGGYVRQIGLVGRRQVAGNAAHGEQVTVSKGAA